MSLSLQIPMRWGDMDAYGHINNVEIVRILEEARVHAFGPPPGLAAGVEVELPIFADLPEGIQALVVEHRIKYLASLHYRNVPAKVDVWISAVKGASFTVAYAIFDPVAGTKCVIAETTLAYYDEPAGQLIRLLPEKKQMLSALLGEPNFR